MVGLFSSHFIEHLVWYEFCSNLILRLWLWPCFALRYAVGQAAGGTGGWAGFSNGDSRQIRRDYIARHQRVIWLSLTEVLVSGVKITNELMRCRLERQRIKRFADRAWSDRKTEKTTHCFCASFEPLQKSARNTIRVAAFDARLTFVRQNAINAGKTQNKIIADNWPD